MSLQRKPPPESPIRVTTDHSGSRDTDTVVSKSALTTKVIPPTLGYEVPDPKLDLDYVPNEPRALPVNGHRPVAISNSFAFRRTQRLSRAERSLSR